MVKGRGQTAISSDRFFYIPNYLIRCKTPAYVCLIFTASSCLSSLVNYPVGVKYLCRGRRISGSADHDFKALTTWLAAAYRA
jgi:hypothetical protein